MNYTSQESDLSRWELFGLSSTHFFSHFQSLVGDDWSGLNSFYYLYVYFFCNCGFMTTENAENRECSADGLEIALDAGDEGCLSITDSLHIGLKIMSKCSSTTFQLIFKMLKAYDPILNEVDESRTVENPSPKGVWHLHNGI